MTDAASPPPWSPQFYLVLIPEDDKPVLAPFDTFVELVGYLKELLQVPTVPMKLYLFYGTRLYLTKGKNRYLVGPDSVPVPLFDVPEVGEEDREGDVNPAAAGPDPAYQNLTDDLAREETARLKIANIHPVKSDQRADNPADSLPDDD